MGWFDEAFDFTILEEIRGDEENGGYTKDPDDSGGETKWGISKAAYPNLDIKNLTKDQAKMIYKNNYWKREYEFFKNKDLAIRIFDMSVNSGAVAAELMLQRAVNSCGGQVSEDGNIGNITLKAANAIHQCWLLERFRVERSNYYADCVEAKPVKLKYLKGWIWRNYR